MLVIGNTFDPATPFASSQRMAAELADGHFLTVEGFGHTELLNLSRCAQDHVAAYLIDGTVPAEGTICRQDGLAVLLLTSPLDSIGTNRRCFNNRTDWALSGQEDARRRNPTGPDL